MSGPELSIWPTHTWASLSEYFYMIDKALTCELQGHLTHWGRDEVDNISKTTLSNVFPSMNKFEFRIKISLTLVPKGPICNIPVMVQIMAWRRQATGHYLNQWWLVYWRIYASLGLNELRPGDRFSNTYDFLNITALKCSPRNKIHIFQCRCKMFGVKFKRLPL